mgnify:CR=1 FL=1
MLSTVEMLLPLIAVILVIAPLFFIYKKGASATTLKNRLIAQICVFCGVFVLAQPLMQLFVSKTSREIIAVGVKYLRIEGACYVGIGILFMLYGY